jgi:spectinomycin phosphotransferase
VLAPLPTPDGGLLRLLPGGYALALYPYIVGESGGFDDELSGADADELTGMLCSLHAVDTRADGTASRVDTLEVPDRDRLESALARAADDDGWPGPYGDRVRAVLRRHAGMSLEPCGGTTGWWRRPGRSGIG